MNWTLSRKGENNFTQMELRQSIESIKPNRPCLRTFIKLNSPIFHSFETMRFRASYDDCCFDVIINNWQVKCTKFGAMVNAGLCQSLRASKSAYIFGSHVINFNRFFSSIYLSRWSLKIDIYSQLCNPIRPLSRVAHLIRSSMKNTCSDNANHRRTITGDKLISLNLYRLSTAIGKNVKIYGEYGNGKWRLKLRADESMQSDIIAYRQRRAWKKLILRYNSFTR